MTRTMSLSALPININKNRMSVLCVLELKVNCRGCGVCKALTEIFVLKSDFFPFSVEEFEGSKYTKGQFLAIYVTAKIIRVVKKFK